MNSGNVSTRKSMIKIDPVFLKNKRYGDVSNTYSCYTFS